MECTLTSFLLCAFLILTTEASEHGNVCTRPVLSDTIDLDGLQMLFSPGAELALSCKSGYTPISGPRRIVCGASGQWTKTKLTCIPKRCPYPDTVSNGDVYYEDSVYQSTVNYTCNEGYIMIGESMGECLANGTWSTYAPECHPVTCGLAPIPKFGMIIYDRKIIGDTTEYGIGGTYKCLPPYVLQGEARAECTSSGKWTEPPVCQVVTCPSPVDIPGGFKSNIDEREYQYTETIQYGCTGDYVLEGSHQISCQRDGTWSGIPSCKAPCSVGVKRGRVLHKGKKIWIGDLDPNKILHKEIISVYCLDEIRNCGYAVPTQCMDGNLRIPACYQEPSDYTYKFRYNSLPSEISQC